jgi:predicted RNA-binding Zn-ribbon protein involved in translation (DUF1610 family)
MQVRVVIPPGTPYMRNTQVVVTALNEEAADLCPTCGHATLYRLTATVLHDDGALGIPEHTVCTSQECAPDE